MEKPKIKFVGIGGCGNNIAEYLIELVILFQKNSTFYHF
tara:strand:- start:588 stop:704 length:117 start_codon:yes stop_codon:yes gene_type:complete